MDFTKYYKFKLQEQLINPPGTINPHRPGSPGYNSNPQFPGTPPGTVPPVSPPPVNDHPVFQGPNDNPNNRSPILWEPPPYWHPIWNPKGYHPIWNPHGIKGNWGPLRPGEDYV